MEAEKIAEKPVQGISINLDSLLKLSNSLNSSTDKDYILNSALLSIMGKLRVFRAAIFELDEGKTNDFSLTISKGKAGNRTFTFEIKKFSQPYYILQNDSTDCLKFPNPEANTYTVAFPLMENDRFRAFLCFGQRINNMSFTIEELQYAELICQIAQTALCNADNITHLSHATDNLTRKNQLLSSIFEMNRDFATFLSRDQILRILSYRLMGQLMVSKFAVCLKDENGEYLQVVNRFDSDFSREALDEIFVLDSSTMLKDINFSHKVYLEINKTKAKVFVPMTIHSEKRGFMIIGKKLNGEDFTPENFSFIEALANNALAALENERLFGEEIKKKKLENELSLALEIQKNLLPKEVPALGETGYTIAGESLPSRMVGGDYFDYIPIDENKLLVCIADVSGKGIPAALIMANIQAALRVLTPLTLNLSDLVTRINSLVYANTASDKFVTLFIGYIDLRDNSFTYINAGHNPPLLLRRNDTAQFLDKGGLILGIFDGGVPYEEGKVTIEKGDLLCLYTDGVTESPDAEGNEYGEKRLLDLLLAQRNNDADEILYALIRNVESFSTGDSRYDDLTAIVIKRSID